MSFRLGQKDRLSEELKRIGREQLERAQRELREEDFHTAVHQVRKRLKKIRGLLRLVRDHIGQEDYKAENVFFRDLGRLLAPARDAQTDLTTLLAVKECFDDALKDDAFSTLEKELRSRTEQKKDLNDERSLMERVVGKLTEGLERIDSWPLEIKDFSELAPGLERVYRRGRKAHGKCRQVGSPEQFHDWRKRVKYLWYHHRILRPLWPQILRPWAHSLHALSDMLGDAHDLADLAEASRQFELPRDSHQALIGILYTRRKELEEQALALGSRVYAERSGDFVKRFQKYWKVWSP